MSNSARQLCQSHVVSAKVAQVLQTRTKVALERFGERVQRACGQQLAASQAEKDGLIDAAVALFLERYGHGA